MPSSKYQSIPLDVTCKLVQLNFNIALLRSFSLTRKMKCQVDKKEHLRDVLLFLSNGGLSALAAAEKIQAVYEEEAISDRVARKSGRPSDFDEERLNALVHEDPRRSTRELAEKIDTHVTVSRHLLSMGKRVSVAGPLLARYRQLVAQRRPSFNQIIIGSNPASEAQLHERKIMPSVWWDCEGVIHFELLPKNQTITATIYVEQLRRLASAVQQKRQKKQHAIMLQHDNAGPDTAIITKTAIQELGWEVLPHPGYSPDLAPSDYHLFRSLAVNLRGVSFNNDENLQKWLSDFFFSSSSKLPHFYRLGIEQVASRWEEVVNSEGEYIVD
ncbi:hypothetical protein M514_02438 [Trichuris suis]|uniref:Mos1 transposase HTH domain-containing protein n=1 Tax=Trichuris suis TaxID=68888 RepID=A0A085N5N9_9BILA|nr:hypothetical protein M514_02438 [Trichuris suis]